MTLVKRTAFAIVLITVIAVSVATLLVHNQISDLQNQISELQAQNEELEEQNSELQGQISELQNQLSINYSSSPVRISTFEYVSGFYPLGGLTLVNTVKVTIQNSGDTNVSGLTLTVRLLDNKTRTEFGQGHSWLVDGLLAGESREFSGWVYYGVDDYGRSATCAVKLRLGGFVVDEKTFGVNWSPLS